MPYTKPTMSSLLERIKTRLFANVTGTDPSLRNSFLNVLAFTIASVMYGLYGLLDFFIKQVFPTTADGMYLEKWGGFYGISKPPAVKATGIVTITGTDASVLPEGSLMSRSDGVLFSTSEEAIIVSGEAEVGVICQEYGEIGNTDSGASFTLSSSIAGIDNTATLESPGATGGLERGSDADLRETLLDVLRRPPRGGSVSDYERWVVEAIRATRVWVRTYHPDYESNPDQLLLGEVKVFFMIDGTGDGIPTSPQVAIVQEYLESKAEPTAIITAQAPIADSQDYTIDISPNISAVQTDVTNALEDLHLEEAAPGGTITHTRILKSLSAVTSLDDFDIVSPATDIESDPGHISILGTITYGDL